MLRMADSGSVLFFSDAASREIEEYFGVGRLDYPENRVEQAMILVGYDIANDGHTVKSVVTHVMPLRLDEASPAFLKWSGSETIRVNRWFWSLKEKNPNLRRFGWVHSHPNDLPVFLSATDRDSIRKVFNKPDDFHVVLNPHSCCWKVWMGPEPAEVPAIMYADALLGKSEAPEKAEASPEAVSPPQKRGKKNKNYGKPRHNKKKRR